MKITGVVKSAKEITGVEGLKAFEGEINGNYFNYTKEMNAIAGKRIELEKYIGCMGSAYDYTCVGYSRWQASWLKDIQTEVDWSRVPVDAKVKVKTGVDNWKRHFAKWENGKVYTWDLGQTSWTAPDSKAIHSPTSYWSPDEVELVED